MENEIQLVSVHGGHSGQFCNHAADSLEAVIQTYIQKGFAWVGITEHMPPVNDEFLFDEERAAGLDAAAVYRRFGEYIADGRMLQKKYASRIRIRVGMETETYTGTDQMISRLIREFAPDYLVGSVHHVDDCCIDASPQGYDAAVRAQGGIDRFYCRYFDIQYEMLDIIRPRVVGHFDLVRIFDPDYRRQLEKTDIQKRIRRNLKRIRDLDAILDFNVRPLFRGADEPYISRSILYQARELGIPVVPGDDSHGIDTVGLNVEKGIEILEGMGFNTHWVMP